MNVSIPAPAPLTANRVFKSQYSRTLEITLALGVLGHLAFLYLMPPLEVPPFELPPALEPIVVVDPEPEIEVLAPPEEVDPPPLQSDLWDKLQRVPEVFIPHTPLLPQDEPVFPAPARGAATSGGGFIAFDQRPVVIHRVVPRYPRLAQEARAEGTVWVEVLIDRSGRVVEARVVDSDTIELLKEAALEAVQGYLFTPALQRDIPVPARIVVPIEFRLR